MPSWIEALHLVVASVAVWMIEQEVQAHSFKLSVRLIRSAAGGVPTWRREDRLRDWLVESETLGPLSRLSFALGLWLSYKAAPSFRRAVRRLEDPVQLSIKRSFDVAASVVGGLATLPLLATIAVVVKIESRGPVLIRVPSVGRAGQRFYRLKFRTMRVEGNKQCSGDHWGRPLTRTGRFIRRLSLDELPQLLNILRGDMSLVGPRPSIAEGAGAAGNEETWFQDPRIRPGLTGLWQVQSDRTRKRELDLYYAKNWSLAHDAVVMAETLRVVWLNPHRA